MRLLGLGLVLVSGCGLVLDLDPPEGDAGPRVDSGDFDVVLVDIALFDGEVADARADAADASVDALDVGPPFDGGACGTPADCRLGTECLDDCVEGTCVRFDEDEDGICDALDCISGEIVYGEAADFCATRSISICDGEEIEFTEVESCDGVDRDCDGPIDESLGIVSCGVGQCEGPRGCGESCVDGPMTDELCGAGGRFGLDEDCDGRVDEGCADAIACIGIEPGPYTIRAPGDYCLDVGDCGAELTPFSIEAPEALSGVRIYGDMRRVAVNSFVPCDTGSPVSLPRSHVLVGSSLVVVGDVQATNVRFEAAPGLEGPVILVEGGEFRAHHVAISGGRRTALAVRAGSTARLSDVHVTSASIGHTIESEGELVIESSCGGRTNNRGRCSSLNDIASLPAGITKTTPGGSVIHLGGRSASLQMTAVRVRGVGSAAIWADNVASVGVFDSVITATAPQPVNDGETSNDVVFLDDCDGSTIRDSFVINRGSEGSGQSTGVRALSCPVRFSAPHLEVPLTAFHIVGSRNNDDSATGVQCDGHCTFHDISVAGYGPNSGAPLRGVGRGVECLDGDGELVDSRVAGNASLGRVAEATGFRTRNGAIVRSRLFGGNAALATGLWAFGGGDVQMQDSIAIGFGDIADGASLAAFAARGVIVQEGTSFAALHSTIAARTWTARLSPRSTRCVALIAEEGTEISLVSSLLWTSCTGAATSLSYGGFSEDDIVLIHEVGVAEAGNSSLMGSSVPGEPTIDLLFGVIPVPDATMFRQDYFGGVLPNGPLEMTTELDVDRRPRGLPSSIGAFAD